MIDSHLDSDRLHSVAHGLARWSAEEAAHLERCAECRLEWEMVRAARALGRPIVDVLDVDRVAASVRQRLAGEPALPRRRVSVPARWVLGLAAAAVVALAVVFPGGRTGGDEGAPEAAIAVLHELDELTSAQLEAVLETMPPAADEGLHVEAAPIEDLTAQDLERVLRSLE